MSSSVLIRSMTAVKFRPPALIARVWQRLNDDDCLDMAAQMSFYFVLSWIPFCLVLAAIVGWLPSTSLWQSMVEWMTKYLPQGSRHLLFSIILDLTHGYTRFLSFGVLATLWSASSGFVSLMEALSVAHGVRETRGFWKKRLIAVAATIAAAVFFLVSFSLTLLGHTVVTAFFFESQGNYAAAHVSTDVARWLLKFILTLMVVNMANYFLPNVKRSWRWATPGTLFVAVTFILASIGFDFYIRHNSIIPRIYGALAGFIIFMLWIYLSSLILLIGAETDTAIADLRANGASA